MGTWGTGILQDDLAQDIYDRYVDGAGRGGAPDAIIAGLRASCAGELAAADVDAVFWLAVAHAQRDSASLQPEVLRRVTAIVEQGVGLAPWVEAGGGEVGRRKSVLTRFLKSLTHRGVTRSSTGKAPAAGPALPAFDLGDCLSVQLPDGGYAGVVVTRNFNDSTASSFVVSVADVAGPTPPDERAFSPVRWHFVVPDRYPNMVVKYQVYADGLTRSRNRYRRVCRVALDQVPEPLVFRQATWATLWKKLPDALVLTA